MLNSLPKDYAINSFYQDLRGLVQELDEGVTQAFKQGKE